MKILHVVTGLNVGGAEAMLARLTTGQAPGDCDAEVATLIPPGFTGRRMIDAGVTVHSLGMTGAVSGGAATLRLAALLRQVRPDLVMAWMHHAQLAATLAIALSRLDVPVIWNVRHSLGPGYDREKPMTRLILRLQARLSRTPAAILYNSRTAARQYRAIGFHPRREEVIPNGFQIPERLDREASRALLEQKFQIPEGKIIIGMVARSHPMKDAANLVAAFHLLRSSAPMAHLLIVGQGMDEPASGIAEALGRMPKCGWTLAGQRDDVTQWMGGLDILALPSAWGEGFPNVIGEAMARGVPCVGTKVGDTEWIIGATGRSVPVRNPVALAQALGEICRMTREERQAMGIVARQRVADMFAIEDVASRYGALYHEIAGLPPMVVPNPIPTRCEAA